MTLFSFIPIYIGPLKLHIMIKVWAIRSIIYFLKIHPQTGMNINQIINGFVGTSYNIFSLNVMCVIYKIDVVGDF